MISCLCIYLYGLHNLYPGRCSLASKGWMSLHGTILEMSYLDIYLSFHLSLLVFNYTFFISLSSSGLGKICLHQLVWVGMSCMLPQMAPILLLPQVTVSSVRVTNIFHCRQSAEREWTQYHIFWQPDFVTFGQLRLYREIEKLKSLRDTRNSHFHNVFHRCTKIIICCMVGGSRR